MKLKRLILGQICLIVILTLGLCVNSWIIYSSGASISAKAFLIKDNQIRTLCGRHLVVQNWYYYGGSVQTIGDNYGAAKLRFRCSGTSHSALVKVEMNMEGGSWIVVHKDIR
jgi:hypothetical protein